MDALDRMFSVLVNALRTKFPELLGNPFEVAELYQTVIPYRHYRREIGLESNADYELTLMALLSGARGYLVGEGRMQETLRAALAAPDPDTSLFRTFATSRVAVATDALRRFDQSGDSGAEEQPPLGSEPSRSPSSPRFAEPAPTASRAQDPVRPNSDLPPAYSHPLGKPLYGTPGGGSRGRATGDEEAARQERFARPEPAPPEPARPEPARAEDAPRQRPAEPKSSEPARSEPARAERMQEPERETSLESYRASRAESRRETPRETRDTGRESYREPAREPAREPRHITPNRTPARSASPPPSPSPTPSSSSSAAAHASHAMTTPSRSTTASALGGSCRYCGGTLPDGRRIVFCPHCGQNLTIQHCPACSTELELGWKYCTTCGRSVASASASA